MRMPAPCLLLAAALLLLQQPAVGQGATSGAAPVAAPQAATLYGPVRGAVIEGIRVFKGIPYGASTAGENRFRAPRPPAPWQKPRDATRYGPRCYQLPAPPDADSAWRSWTDTSAMSEDCLTLSVWTPALDTRKRPVMVWLHGGGYSVGSGNSSINEGVRLAHRGDVVVVSVNHRLNLFGYLHLGDLGGADFADSGNAGQLDIIAALRWVKENIAQFGGDPGNVMVFGESGGGGKVGALMAMPGARGLFHRAAMQSGFGITFNTRAKATEFAAGFLKELGLKPDGMGELRRLSPEKLLAALNTVTGGSPTAIMPVVDGRHLPRHPFAPDAPDVSADVPLLVGYNAAETTVLFPPPGVFDLDWPKLEQQLQKEIPGMQAAPIVAGLRRLRPDATPSDLYFFITTERGMGNNARTVAERKAKLGRAPVFLYRLAWPTPVLGGKLRTPHSLDIPMVFDNVASSTSLVGDDIRNPQKVADAMSAAWIAFARSGTPNGRGLAEWPAFSLRKRSVMGFNVVSQSVDDPLRREHAVLAAWLVPPAMP
jgi:para-nitrobenzyl esterase